MNFSSTELCQKEEGKKKLLNFLKKFTAVDGVMIKIHNQKIAPCAARICFLSGTCKSGRQVMNWILGGEQDSSCAQKIVTGLSRIPQEGFSRVLLVAVSENGSRRIGNQKEWNTESWRRRKRTLWFTNYLLLKNRWSWWWRQVADTARKPLIMILSSEL